jgi:exodeoxyribonuclease V beta subunit
VTSPRSRPAEPPAFNLCGPLPSGVTLLEASAGTGKTYTIAALVTRYVAAGVGLDRLLVVTFTRMATGELRERVRERLLATEEGLTLAIAGAPLPAGDEIVAFLADGAPEEVALRRDRLAAAVAGFDAATIETTHGFCLRVLTGLGVAGDVEPDTTLEPDVADLIEEVVDDLYVRRFWPHDTVPAFPRKIALEVGRAVAAHQSARLVPERTAGDEPWAMRRRLADAVRRELDRRKRAAKVLTYDDVLIQLRATLADPRRGPIACERLRTRYQVALIDEFQDTDPVQWDIVRSAFGQSPSTLVLIGDPKQAIYAFRGADVHAYLEAAAQAGSEATLGTNWRSDQALLDTYDAMLAGTRLGEEGIVYRHVRAARAGVGLAGAPVSSPLRIRIARRDSGFVDVTKTGLVAVASGRPFVATDVAADISRLLGSGATLAVRSAGDVENGRTPVRPGHVAVLVRTNVQAELVRSALHAAGVPAVVGGSASVFAEPAADAWRRLLDALEQPTSPSRAASAALTAFIGWTADEVATADPDTWEDLHWRLHRWAALLRRRGVAALLENITASNHLPARLLAHPGGERELSDVRHLGELLHAITVAEGLGVTALGAWLRRRIADARAETGDEDRTRRLESDAEAVQVLTIHRAKGLEFPIVYCPYLWDENDWEPEVSVFHDPAAGGVRTIDVGGKDGPDYHEHWAIQLREERGEDLRLLYVALTRARHQAVVWWAGSAASRNSPLGRLLFARDADGVINHQGKGVPSDDDIAVRVAELAAASGAGISVEDATGGPALPWEDSTRAVERLEVAVFDRELDQRWSRTSYSAITADAHGPRVGSESETELVSDEESTSVPTPVAADGDDEALRAAPVLLAAMTTGARVGTLVHRVLERTDFTAADLRGDLRALVDRELARDALDLGDRDAVTDGLAAMIESPLGALANGLRLRDFSTAERLDELSFELPLAGGDTPSGELSVADIAGLLAAHLPADDPLASYPARLADPGLDRTLRGYLTGSIDVVLRVDRSRFVVCDYKTNWLGMWDDPLTAWHYRPAVLVAAMGDAHYPLQAILYAVALHRYLRWRLPGYDPTVNLGGVLYLFARGMSSPEHPTIAGQPCGVFAWQPPVALIEALSDLFDQGRRAA